MTYYTYLDLANAYEKQNNYYNAILAYQEIISRQETVCGGFNNIAVIFNNLGLQRHAFSFYSKAISHFEEGKCLLNSEAWKYYNNRAHYYSFLDKKELMYIDIKRALSLNPGFGEVFFAKTKFEILNNQKIDDNFEFNSFLPPEHEKAKLFYRTGMAYEKVRENQKALENFLKSDELKRSKESLYQIGKQYFNLGIFDEARKYFSLSQTYISFPAWHQREKAHDLLPELETQDSFREAYDKVSIQFGIVQMVDIVNSVGFILGNTWFNKFDTIKFEFKNCAIIPQKEDRVRFELDYIFYNGKYRPIAKCVEIHNHTNNPKFFEKKIFHCIVHGGQNTFKSFSNFKYILCYYPSRTFLPFAAIEQNLGRLAHFQLKRTGHIFMEISIEIQDLLPKVVSCKPIKPENKYATKKISSRSKRYSTNEHFDYSWTCSICDGDTSTGCQMSDPQNCPKGRGI